MKRTTLALASIVAGAVAALAADPATAEQLPVAVDCSIESDELRVLWGEEAASTVADDLCRRLIEDHLDGHLRLHFWHYVSADSDAAAQAAVTLHFSLLDGSAANTFGRLRLLRRGEPEPHCPDPQGDDGSTNPPDDVERLCWQNAVHDPGEEGFPFEDEAAGFYPTRLRDKVVDPFQIEVEDALKAHAALARAVWHLPRGEPPRLVTSLPWGEFRDLRRSRFQVLCRHANATDRRLPAVGDEDPALFPGSPPISQALTVKVEVESLSADEADHLEPHSVYLKTFEPLEIRTVPVGFDPGGGGDG